MTINCSCDTFSSSTSATALTATNTGTGHAAYVSQTAYNVDTMQIVSNASSNSALFCYQTGNGNGCSAQSTGSGIAGYFFNTGTGNGVTTTAISGTGLNASSSSGAAITASSNTASATIYTTNNNASSGYALQAFAYGSNSTGIYGKGNLIGIYGECDVSGGFGVEGSSNVNGGTGVKGTNIAASGSALNAGVYGSSLFGAGVYGTSNAINSYGVYANNSGSGAAFYCSGTAIFSGYVSKSGGGYRIDHPQDPENKYLNHHFVESSEMKNVYDGVAILNSSGGATISLPNYFEAANSDFRYQLTPMGGAMPNLHVSSKVSGNQFSVAGGIAGAEISWQLTGVRSDKWALANNPGVEIEKKGSEKGKFMHPELFGKDDSFAIDQMRVAKGAK